MNVDAGTLLISHYRTGRRVACSAYLCGGVMVNRGSRVNMWWNSVDEGIPLDT